MRDELFELHAAIEERHWWFTARREIVRRLLHRVVPPGEGRRLVDLGCGSGGNLGLFESDYSGTGFDASATAVQLAQERFPRIEFVCRELSPVELPALDGADGVLLLDVLEHVQEDAELLAAVVGGMRPGAHLLLTVPADPRLWSEHDESFGHFRRYEGEGLAELWSELPVEARLTSYCNSRLYLAMRAVRSWRRRRDSGGSRTDFDVPTWPLNGLLRRIFSGEAGRLLEAMDASGGFPYRRGASLVAVLRRS